MTTISKTFVSDVAESARGQWDSILASQGINVPFNKHCPCPVCADGTDRFRFDDKFKTKGDGGYICSQCGSGDGLNLLQGTLALNAKDAAKLVAGVLGIDTENPIKIDREAINKKKELNRQEEQRRLAKIKDATAKRTQQIFSVCKQGESDYLKKKNLPPDGLMFNTAIQGLKPPLLAIPYYQGRDVVQLQLIENPSDDGKSKKRFLKGEGTQKDTYHLIDGKNDQVFIGEGYATTLTPCMLKGLKGYVAGSANNIPAIALTAREQNPHAKIVILVDNNKSGHDANEKAHALLGDSIGIVPPDNDPKIKDWNDYFQKYGAEKTLMEIDNSLSCEHETDIVPRDDSTLASQVKDEVVTVENVENKVRGLMGAVSNGGSKKMAEAMKDEVHYMEGIAIVGQFTVIYAAPNAGKTLLTFHLIIEQIKAGVIDPADVFYVNADDNHRGSITKLQIAEKYGFNMLIPNQYGFTIDMMGQEMRQMIEDDTAAGAILIFDTIKKFTNLMDKSSASAFSRQAREFVLKGGSVLCLAHVNKHKNGDGKSIYAGTSDLVDDADCAYVLEVLTENKQTGQPVLVQFENIKSRGNNTQEVGYTYTATQGGTYNDLLDSIEPADKKAIEEQRRLTRIAQGLSKDEELIENIRLTILEGSTSQTAIIKTLNDEFCIGKRRTGAALRKYTGIDWAMGHRWFSKTNGTSEKEYELTNKPYPTN